MTFSLYDATIATFLQGLGGVADVLRKARDHADEPRLAILTETALHPDMKPLAFQVRFVVHHSCGAVEGLRHGTFSPVPPSMPTLEYGGLQALISRTHDRLATITPEAIETLAMGSVVLVVGDRRIPFAAVDFLLSFSLPNFYFHATTAYDILRANGIPLEKRDYLGKLRFASPPS